MDKSYLYIKAFIENQIHLLNGPIELTSELGIIADNEGINRRELQIILARINMLIRRHNKTVFSPQIINQIINQVIKSERNKLELVNERLSNIKNLMIPILVPDSHILGNLIYKLQEFNRLVNELPEGKYLFMTRSQDEVDIMAEQDMTLNELGSDNEDDNDDDNNNGLIQDDQQRIVNQDNTTMKSQYNRNIYRMVDEQVKPNEELLKNYEEIRLQLVTINHDVQYKYQKMRYLQQLRDKLGNALGITIKNDELEVNNNGEYSQINNEINKFKILSDSINFKVNNNNKIELANIIHDI